MIDTKELRAFCDEECHPNGSLLRNTVDELDRLYELERLNTPFASRELVEEYLNARDFGMKEEYTNEIYSKDYSLSIKFDSDGYIQLHLHKNRSSFTLPLSAVTPALLNKLLEGK